MKKKRKLLILCTAVCMLLLGGSVQVQAEEKIIRDFSKIFYIPAGAVEKGQSLDGLRETYDALTCTAYTQDGEELVLPVSWDYSRIDLQKTGAYQITGSVLIPEEYRSEAEIPTWTVGISVQNPGQPEIQVYSEMHAAGLFYFPWVTQRNPDTMEIWIQQEGEAWVNASEEGYGMCDTDGMYLSCQSMLPGKIYTLTVLYDSGKTKNLKYRYGTDGELAILSYTPGIVGETVVRDYTIRSCENLKSKSLERCMAYAVAVGQDLSPIKEELEETFHMLGSTQEEYEDTAAHPSVVMPSKWDFTAVDVGKPGVYKVTGTFQAPEGYRLLKGLTLPVAVAYINVQRADAPEIQTYYVSGTNSFSFPMVLSSFSKEELEQFRVYLMDGEKEVLLDEKYGRITGNGLYLKRNALQMNHDYGLYVSYPGGNTGVYAFHYDTDFIKNEQWYERNYADRDGNDLPDIDNGTEEVTHFATVITGNRLMDLMGTKVKTLPFEKDGVLIRIPVEAVKEWNVKPDDEIRVEIVKKENEVSFNIYKNGNEITDIPGSTVEIPYSQSGTYEVALEDESGNSYEGTLQDTQKVAVIPVDQTGDYEIKETETAVLDEGTEAESGETKEEAVEKEPETQSGTRAPEEDASQDSYRKRNQMTALLLGGIILLAAGVPLVSQRHSRKLRKGERSEGEKRVK